MQICKTVVALVWFSSPFAVLSHGILHRHETKSSTNQVSLEQIEVEAWWRGHMHVHRHKLGFLQLQRTPTQSRGNAKLVSSRTEQVPLQVKQKLLICEVTLGDGRSFKALVDTGSGNLAVPSADCRSQGCRGRRGFEPEDDTTGRFLPGATDLHLSFATGKLAGSGFEGKVCFGHVCGQAGFLVAAMESAEFQHFSFDGILGLGPPRQALAPGFNIIGSLAKQGALPSAAFVLSLRSQGNSSLKLGGLGRFGDEIASANSSFPGWLKADARHGEWAVDLQDIKVDGQASQACAKEGCRAVLDSGCGGIALPAHVLKSIEKRLRMDGCSERAIQELPTLGFVFGNGHTYNLRPEKYVEMSTARISQQLTDDDSDDIPHCRLLIHPTGEYSMRTAILGLPFLFDRDIAFDQGHMRVALADA
jgi:hypothetical protein